MTTSSARRRAPLQGEVDFTIMYAAHDAFSRDLRRLIAAVKSGWPADVSTDAGWATFKNQLHIHHTIEDVALWPPLRDKLTRPADLAVLEAMETEHARIDPLLSGVDASFAAGDKAALAENAEALATALTAHMENEEDHALPLVETYLGTPGYAAFGTAIRKRQGLSGGAEFLPWLLDGASADATRRVLGTLPAPARLLYRAAWRPRYARTPRWTSTVPAAAPLHKEGWA